MRLLGVGWLGLGWGWSCCGGGGGCEGMGMQSPATIVCLRAWLVPEFAWAPRFPACSIGTHGPVCPVLPWVLWGPPQNPCAQGEVSRSVLERPGKQLEVYTFMLLQPEAAAPVGLSWAGPTARCWVHRLADRALICWLPGGPSPSRATGLSNDRPLSPHQVHMVAGGASPSMGVSM